MPKVPVDYSKTCIYKLVHFDDLNDENIYIGHTTNMVQRRHNHKTACCSTKHKEYNKPKYQYIRANGGWDKWQMILIEKYPCNIIDEATAREQYWRRRLNATLNTNEPGRKSKQYYQDKKDDILIKTNKYRQEHRNDAIIYSREYYKNNHEERLEKQRKYRENNKEEIMKKKKEKITCGCGSVVVKDMIVRHRKTIKHQEWLKNNNLCTN